MKTDLEIKEYLITTTAKILKLSREEAEKRLSALYKYDIRESGNPDDPATQMMLDVFIQIPSKDYEGMNRSEVLSLLFDKVQEELKP